MSKEMTLSELKAAKDELETSIGDSIHAAICRFMTKASIPVMDIRVEQHLTDESVTPKWVSASVQLDLNRWLD